MPQFTYTVVDQNGKRITKSIMATNSDEVVASLKSQGMTIVSVKDQSSKKTDKKLILKTKEKISFTENVSVLLSSGISLGEALSIIANDTTDKKLGQFYQIVLSDIERGYPLSKSLGQFPYNFDTIYLSLVEAGENSGQLDIVMKSLAEGLDRDARTVAEVRSAMMYPGIVLFSLFILGTLITFFVLPKMTTVFEQLNVNLPLLTRLLLGFSKFANGNVILLSILIVVAMISFIILIRLRKTKQLFTRIGLRTPLFSQILLSLDLSRIASTLSLLLNAGVPVQNAIRIASGTVINPKLNKQFQVAAENLSAGKGLGPTLKETDLPSTFVALVAVGERSGNIASVFEKLAKHYQDQLNTALKNFTGALEPLLTLLVGLIVGGMVVVVMLPLYSVFGNLESLR